MNYKSIINAVAVAVAVMAVMFVGCGGDDDDDNGGGGGGGGGTPTVKTGTFTDSRDSKSYNWVEIGTQKWMAENLNYAASGSKCGNESSGMLTENSTACNKYGRLYNWATAVDGSPSSSSSPSGVQGACPVGWHLPSDAEWTTLTDAVGGASTAGVKLKATSGWNDYQERSGNGTNDYGFAALPGGFGTMGSGFTFNGTNGRWWSATVNNASNVWYRDMSYNNEYVLRTSGYDEVLFSVRCVED